LKTFSSGASGPAAVGNNWFGSVLLRFIAQFVAVVGLAAKQVFGWFNSIHEALCDWAIVCEFVDLLRVAPAARAPNSPFLVPLFRLLPRRAPRPASSRSLRVG
jgi:hypothetical protein